MKQRINYYKDLVADYSRPEPVSPSIASKLIEDAQRFIALKEKELPTIGPDYPLAQIEKENKEWWPTHCEALRRGRGDLLTLEYHKDLVYFCQDGPFYGSRPAEGAGEALVGPDCPARGDHVLADRDVPPRVRLVRVELHRCRDPGDDRQGQRRLGPPWPSRRVLLQRRAVDLLSRRLRLGRTGQVDHGLSGSGGEWVVSRLTQNGEAGDARHGAHRKGEHSPRGLVGSYRLRSDRGLRPENRR